MSPTTPTKSSPSLAATPREIEALKRAIDDPARVLSYGERVRVTVPKYADERAVFVPVFRAFAKLGWGIFSERDQSERDIFPDDRSASGQWFHVVALRTPAEVKAALKAQAKADKKQASAMQRMNEDLARKAKRLESSAVRTKSAKPVAALSRAISDSNLSNQPTKTALRTLRAKIKPPVRILVAGDSVRVALPVREVDSHYPALARTLLSIGWIITSEHDEMERNLFGFVDVDNRKFRVLTLQITSKPRPLPKTKPSNSAEASLARSIGPNNARALVAAIEGAGGKIAFVADPPKRVRTKPETTRKPRPIPCKSRLLGKVIPGRRGGEVTSCATRDVREPTKKRVWIGGVNDGHDLKMTVASRRLRDAAKNLGEMRTLDLEYVAAGVAYAMDSRHVPAPIGVEFPHRAGSSSCDPEHKRWAGYDEALEAARERAAIEVGDDGTEELFERHVLAILRKHPKFKQWFDTETACVQGFEQRQKRKKLKQSLDENAVFQRDFKAAGGDTSSLEYLERVSDETRAKKLAASGKTNAAKYARRKRRVKAFRQ